MSPFKDQAIYKLYPNVVSINAGTDAYDKDGNLVYYDEDVVNNECILLEEEYNITKCKNKAKSLLAATDWVEVPSVSDSSVVPYLTNVKDFIDYRNTLRPLAVNPIANPVWPELPIEIWN